MFAFVKTNHGLFKIYRDGDDWQILGPDFERWFSDHSSTKQENPHYER